MKRALALTLLSAALLSGCTHTPTSTPTTAPDASRTASSATAASTPAPAVPATGGKVVPLRDGLSTVAGTALLGDVEDRSDADSQSWYAVLELSAQADLPDVAAAFADQLADAGLKARTDTIEEGLEVSATRTRGEQQTTFDIVLAGSHDDGPGYVAVMVTTVTVPAAPEGTS